MRKKLLSFLLLAILAAGLIIGSGICRSEGTPEHAVLGASKSAIDVQEDGWYDSRDEVALYLRTYGHLPYNDVTKKEARKAGWESGSLENFFPGCSIGGDVFQNRKGCCRVQKGGPIMSAISTPREEIRADPGGSFFRMMA